MTGRDCVCGLPLHNHAEFCRDCEKWARRRLADQAAYYAELHAELARQTRKQAPNDGGKSAETPLPFSPLAGVLIRQQVAWLADWWQVVHDTVPAISGPICAACDRGMGNSCQPIRNTWQPVNSVAGVAMYLETHLAVLRKHPRGREFVTSLRRLTGRIVRLIDAPEIRTRINVGPCPEQLPDDQGGMGYCPGQVEAIVPADESVPATMRCLDCGHEWADIEWNRAGRRINARAEQLQQQRQLAMAITRGTM